MRAAEWAGRRGSGSARDIRAAGAHDNLPSLVRRAFNSAFRIPAPSSLAASCGGACSRGCRDELATIGELVSRVREVNLAGDEVRLTLYELPPGSAPGHVSQFFDSIAWTEFDIERSFASRAAVSAAQLPFE